MKFLFQVQNTVSEDITNYIVSEESENSAKLKFIDTYFPLIGDNIDFEEICNMLVDYTDLVISYFGNIDEFIEI